MEHFRILNQFMVQLIDLSWNTIEASLVLMYEKLVALGFSPEMSPDFSLSNQCHEEFLYHPHGGES